MLSPVQAVLIGMTLNAGAYLTEIQRAGFQSLPAAEIDAAETLGFSRLQTIRHVIAPHIIAQGALSVASPTSTSS